MAGLFSTLNISTRGMSVQQKAIDITSHNISNASTDGYSRQRAVIETTEPYTMPATNSSTGAGQVGTGAQVTAIERYRDSFLDYQIRTQTSTKGQYDTIQTQLGEVESIFNEPSDTGLSTLMSKFYSSWQDLSKSPDSSDARTVVAQQSAALADGLNSEYSQLTKLKENTQTEVKNSIVNINSQLDQISKLNQQIVDVSVSGDKANDLMDKRDSLLDQLSSEFNINISNAKLDGINVSPVDTSGVTSPNMVSAVQDGGDKRLSYISDITQDPSPAPSGQYTVTYYSSGDMSSEANKHTITLSNVTAQQAKDMDENRTIWTDSKGIAIDSSGSEITDGSTNDVSSLMLFQPSDGEMKGYTTVQQDIDGYIDQLNSVAKVLAFSVNAIHSGMTDPQPSSGTPAYDGMPFFVNGDVAKYNPDNTMSNLTGTGGILDSEQYITAGNISVNKQIMNDVSQIKTRTNDDQYLTESDNTVDGEADGARAAAIADLENSLIKISDVGTSINQRSDLFSSGENGGLTNNGMTIGNNTNGTTVEGYFKDTIDKLGIQSQEAQRMVTNQDTLLSNFQDSKASISGVSLDEEMTNLIQYQHAYQANAKVISTIDELLDVVINSLKK